MPGSPASADLRRHAFAHPRPCSATATQAQETSELRRPSRRYVPSAYPIRDSRSSLWNTHGL